MCQSANIVWSHVYKDGREHDKVNPDILALEKLSSRFMNCYHSAISKRNVNPNESKPIVDAVDVLCKKLIGWLYVDKKDSDEENAKLAIECQK